MKRFFTELKALPGAVWVLFFVRLILSAGAFVNPFMTLVLKEHVHLNDAAVGLVLSLSAIAGALGLVLGGKLGDMFKKPILLSIFQLGTGAAFVVCGLVGFHPVLAGLLLLSVLLMSSSWPILNSLVADITPVPSQKLAFSLLYWGNNVGFSIGPLAAGFLFNSAPRMLFFGNALVLMVAGLLVLRIRDDASSSEPASGLPTQERSIFSILKERPLILLFGLSALAGAFIYSQHTFSVPLLLNDRFGASSGPKIFGMLMSLNGLTVVICTLPITAVSRKWPTLISVAISILIYGIGFGLYGVALSVISTAILTVFWTLGEILGATNTNVFVAQKSPPEYRSRMNSFISLCYTAGNFLGPLVIGSLIETRGLVYVWPVLFIAGVATTGYLVLLWLWSERRKTPLAG